MTQTAVPLVRDPALRGVAAPSLVDPAGRAMTIAQMIDKGYSINEIVRATGVSRSTVKEHLKKRPRDDRQGSLF